MQFLKISSKKTCHLQPCSILTDFAFGATQSEYGEVAQTVRACGSYPQCRGFNSLPRYQNTKNPVSAGFFYAI